MGKNPDSLAAINQRLKAALCPLRLRQRGNALYLRGTFPPKPGTEHTGSRQYDISLGVLASADGLRRAYLEAQQVGTLLAMGQFTWERFLGEKQPEQLAISTLIEQFQAHYMATHQLSEDTWKRHWLNIYKRLPQDEKLTSAVLLQQVLATAANTRDRKQTCDKLQKLADFANCAINLKSYQGSYSASNPTEVRDPPANGIVQEWRDRVPNQSWQWFYGMVATFGLRPHEVFFCEFETPRRLKVNQGKTGSRTVRPYFPEWVDLWDLTDVHRPAVTGRTNREYGERAATQFLRYEMPFAPYDLRHAFAIRLSLDFKLPPAIAAKEMGHSPATYLRHYQRWISGAEQDTFYERIISDPSRPFPPSR
jgi:integrase